MSTTSNNYALQGTSAHSPDLAWSQVRETVLMLELAAGQIEAAMTDSGASVEVLTDSFTSMANYMQSIGESINAIKGNGDANEAIKENLSGTAGQVSAMIHQAIIAFQFYDKLVQRLAHVCHGLSDLSSLVCDTRRLYNPEEWVGVQTGIKSKYTTEEEHLMFEHVMKGMPVDQAIRECMAALKNKNNDIEFF
jgi:hypothetical protein